MSAKADDYYYNQLNKEQKKVYYAMKEGLLKMQDSFPVLKLSNKEPKSGRCSSKGKRRFL